MDKLNLRFVLKKTSCNLLIDPDKMKVYESVNCKGANTLNESLGKQARSIEKKRKRIFHHNNGF